MTVPDQLRAQIRALPDTPGVYKYYDKEDALIYVGKAKSLRKRVASYFNKPGGMDRKTLRLVLSIKRLEFTVVDSEYDALLLENNLIKQNQPKYNINLKDDKTYPYLIVTNDRFPKIFPTRRLVKGQGTYYGPYASGKTMHTLLELLKKLFTFRTCNLFLSPQNIAANKFKVCLEYHIGNCKGPCQAYQTEEDYMREVAQAMRILKGNLGPAKAYFRERMGEYAQSMQFEKAQQVKERLDTLEKYEARSLIVNPDMGDVDVFTILSDGEVFVNYLQVSQGMIVHTHTVEIKKKLEETDEDMLLTAMIDMRQEFQSESKEIVSNIPITFDLKGIKTSVPQVGDKKKLVDLSMKNAIYFKHDKEEKQKEQPRTQPNQRVLLKLQQDLQLKEYPDHIECFDNSNTQGTNPVAAMVCFKNGAPSKKDYRHYLVRTVEGPDDFASMREIVGRRYRRVLEENEPLPKLILIDGGKGQLSAAVESLKELDLYGKIPIVGIAKRLEELFYPEDPYPLLLDKKGESLKLLQRVRDEAHRFGITHHRERRSKELTKLSAEDIPGIGPKTLEMVQKHFKSLKSITPERVPELEQLIGKKKARVLAGHLGLLVKGPV